MRTLPARARLAPVLLALAGLVAACSVDVDGAPCAVPGASADCPGGQACGNDRRCSARALACVATRCTPGVGGDCLDAEGVASGTARARSCSGIDPVCGRWMVDDCARTDLRCGQASGGARCECPAPAAHELLVLPDGSRAGGPPYPSGAAWPPGCAFRTLTDALARAQALRALDPSLAVSVVAAGTPSGATRTFSGAGGERFPLVVPQGVELRSDAAATGAAYEVVFDAASATSAALELRTGSRLAGFTVRNADRDRANVGIDVSCLATSAHVDLSSVTVEGRGPGGARLGIGMRAGGSCQVDVRGLEVREAGAAGLWWASGPGGILWVRDTSVSGGAGAGIVLCGGGVTLARVRVAGNAGRGIEGTALLGAWVESSKIVGNGDTGVAFRDALGVVLRGNTVFGNGAREPWVSTSSGVARRGGGLVLSGTPPPPDSFEVSGTRIYANAGDQVLVLGPPSGTWILDQPATCLGAQGPVTNMIGCYDPVAAGTTGASRGIVAVDVGASALNQWWERGTPSPALDVAQLPSGSIPAATSCLWATPALDCASEDPPP